MTAAEIQPYQDNDQLYEAAAESFCKLAKEAVGQRGRFAVSLSGGSTPKKLYEMLSQCDLPWKGLHWFWGDERNVPPDHTESNYRMVVEALLSRVPVPQENIHAVAVNVDEPAQAARAYQAHLQEFFAGQAFPQWDLALLGMGDDAHTASLFPQTAAVNETQRWFVENWVEKLDAFRYTLTAPAINSAREIWFLVTGEAKRDAIARVLGPNHDPSRYPSQLIRPTQWFVTADAV